MSLPGSDNATVLALDSPVAGADLGAVIPSAEGTIEIVQSLYARDTWPDGSVLFTNEGGSFKAEWHNNQLIVTRGAATVKSLATEPNGWPGNVQIPLAITFGPLGLELYVDGARVALDPTVSPAAGQHLMLGPASTPIRYQSVRVSSVRRARREILANATGQPVYSGDTPYERLQPIGTAIAPTLREEGVGTAGPGVKGVAVFEPTVLKNPFAPGWLMFYSGGGYAPGSTMSYCTLLARADTPAGPWRKRGVVVGNGRGGESGHAVRNSAFVEAGVLYLFYAAGDEAGADLRVISTRDLVTWTAPVTVMARDANAGSDGVANTALIKRGGRYWLYHEDHRIVGSWELMLSTGPSPLGPFVPAPALTGLTVPVGSGGSHGIAGGPWIWPDAGGTLHMLYHASWRTTTLPSLLMHAISTDGGNWVRSPYNPICPWLGVLPDQDQMGDACVVEDRGKVYVFFDVDSNAGGYTARIEAMSCPGTLQDLFALSPPPPPAAPLT